MAQILEFLTINLAVNDLDSAVDRYRAMGLKPHPPNRMPEPPAQITDVSVPLGSVGHVSIISPTDPSSTVARFLDKRGEGAYSIALRVDNLLEIMEEWSAIGIACVFFLFTLVLISWIHAIVQRSKAIDLSFPGVRWYALFSLISVAFVVWTMGQAREERIEATRATLEAVYDSLADQIGHLPDSMDDPLFDSCRESGRLPSGYWKSETGQTFEVWYHYGSDSYALRYPERRWDWRRYGYRGPQPGPAAADAAEK